jgi:predicted 2-oxoglutarate/Fe(II)-dependent dioxygenase YbiX
MIQQYPRHTILLHDFLFSQTCRQLIDDTESIGFEEAKILHDGVEVSAPNIRNNDRVIIDNEVLASQWWDCLEELIPEFLQQWNAVSLNERLRFYRYKSHQLFRFHRDTPFSRDGLTSSLSVIVYLNSQFEGGETDFRDFSVSPVEGAALIFPHHLLHEGASISNGVKYAVRTDIMCEPDI